MTFPKKKVLGSNIYPKIWRFVGYSLTLAIIYFSLNSSYPLKQAIINIPFGDQLIHLCAYGFLMYCFGLSWKQQKIQLILAFGLVILGITLEILQAFMHGVDLEFGDNLANILGVVIGYLFANLRIYQSRRVFS